MKFTNEYVASNSANTLVEFINMVNSKGIEETIKTLLDAVNSDKGKHAKEIITVSELTLWCLEDDQKQRISSMENSTLNQILVSNNFSEKPVSDEAIALIVAKLDFEDIENLMLKKLKELNFNFEAYSQYTKTLKKHLQTLKTQYNVA